MLNRYFAIPLVFILVFAAISLSALAIAPVSLADDFWETPTPTHTPGTPTPYPVPPSSTVIATPPDPSTLPGPGSFPVPTSIPAISFPPVPSPISLDPIPTPLPFALTPIVTDTDYFSDTLTSTLDLSPISDTVTLSYTEFITLSFSDEATGTVVYTAAVGILDAGTAWINDVVSYTDWFSDEIGSLEQSDTFTLSSAPAWYAPDLPRSMADIGWTYEQLEPDIDNGERYSLNHWAWFMGYIASLPFQFVKVVFLLFQFIGPLGLYVIWLLIMLPYKLWVKFLMFIKNTLISLLNTAIQLPDIFLAVLRTIADYFIPW